MNYFLPIHCGSPDMANNKKFKINKWFIINFTYSTNRTQPNKNLFKGQYLQNYLAGFIDADGNFYIRNSLKQIICKFALEQRMIYPKTNESYNFILNKICLALNVKLHSRIRAVQKDSYYIIRVENQNSIKLLIDYLDIFPLKSSKHLDFLCWKLVFNEIINKNHLTVEGRKIVSTEKGQMNDSRTFFNWDHLNF